MADQRHEARDLADRVAAGAGRVVGVVEQPHARRADRLDELAPPRAASGSSEPGTSCSLSGSTTIVTPAASASGAQRASASAARRELRVALRSPVSRPTSTLIVRAPQRPARSIASTKRVDRLGAPLGHVEEAALARGEVAAEAVDERHVEPEPPRLGRPRRAEAVLRPPRLDRREARLGGRARGRSRYGSSRKSADRCADQITARARTRRGTPSARRSARRRPAPPSAARRRPRRSAPRAPGCPVRLSGAVLKQSRAAVRPETSANEASSVSSFGAVSGSVGVSSASQCSSARLTLRRSAEARVVQPRVRDARPALVHVPVGDEPRLHLRRQQRALVRGACARTPPSRRRRRRRDGPRPGPRCGTCRRRGGRCTAGTSRARRSRAGSRPRRRRRPASRSPSTAARKFASTAASQTSGSALSTSTPTRRPSTPSSRAP